MVLIFGGAYQGKLSFALDKFELTDDDVYYCDENNIVMPENKKIFYEIDKWILALVKANIDVTGAMQQFTETNTSALVSCNDISCGVVPVDPQMRIWREAVGRSLALLSRNASEVIRLFCGIATRIK
jgi:adenosyl cobinamide kinase/adenosyl cobinamide phosphate guanylyltransferase